MKSFASQREILEIAIVSKDRQCFEGSASLIILPKSPSGPGCVKTSPLFLKIVSQ